MRNLITDNLTETPKKTSESFFFLEGNCRCAWLWEVGAVFIVFFPEMSLAKQCRSREEMHTCGWVSGSRQEKKDIALKCWLKSAFYFWKRVFMKPVFASNESLFSVMPSNKVFIVCRWSALSWRTCFICVKTPAKTGAQYCKWAFGKNGLYQLPTFFQKMKTRLESLNWCTVFSLIFFSTPYILNTVDGEFGSTHLRSHILRYVCSVIQNFSGLR